MFTPTHDKRGGVFNNVKKFGNDPQYFPVAGFTLLPSHLSPALIQHSEPIV